MRKTMNQTTTRGSTYVSKTRAPWTVALHRKVAAAASIAVCVFSIRMRDQMHREPRLAGCNEVGEGNTFSIDDLQDARRREGSP